MTFISTVRGCSSKHQILSCPEYMSVIHQTIFRVMVGSILAGIVVCVFYVVLKGALMRRAQGENSFTPSCVPTLTL